MDDLLTLTKKLCLEVDENRRKIADLEKFRNRNRYPEDGKTTFLMRCDSSGESLTYDCFTTEEAAEVLGRRVLGNDQIPKHIHFTLESPKYGLVAYFAKREYSHGEEIITVKLDKTSIHNNVAKEKIKQQYQRLWPVSEKLSRASTEIAYELKSYSFPCSVVTKVNLESFGEAAHIFSRRLGMAKPQDCK